MLISLNRSRNRQKCGPATHILPPCIELGEFIYNGQIDVHHDGNYCSAQTTYTIISVWKSVVQCIRLEYDIVNICTLANSHGEYICSRRTRLQFQSHFFKQTQMLLFCTLCIPWHIHFSTASSFKLPVFQFINDASYLLHTRFQVNRSKWLQK